MYNGSRFIIHTKKSIYGYNSFNNRDDIDPIAANPVAGEAFVKLVQLKVITEASNWER